MNLKSTNFAVLGQLALRPWSAYELIQEMKRNFHYFYPRAESGLYEALKKLESLGYASAEVKTKGKKDRTEYQITEEGRKALRQWLETEPEAYRLEFDGLLRVFLAKFGDAEALKNSLQKVSEDAETLLSLAEKVGNEYLTDTAPAQSEIAQRVCVFDFLLHYGMMYREWLSRTEAYLNEIEGMPESLVSETAKGLIREHMKTCGLTIKGD